MKCQNCGSDLKEGQKFCESCGAPVNTSKASEITNVTSTNVASASVSQTTNDNFNQPKKNKNTKVGLIIFIVVIVLALVVGIPVYTFNKVARTAKGIINGVGEVVEDTIEQVEKDVDNYSQNIETKLEWETPIVKLDKENQKVKNDVLVNTEISDLSNYEVYSAVISFDHDTVWAYSNKLHIEDGFVFTDGCGTSCNKGDGRTKTYYPVCIVIDSNKDINDIEIMLEKDEKVKILTKDNNVKPKESGEVAEIGDCISCKLDGCQTYIVLADMDDHWSTGGGGFANSYPGEHFDIVSMSIDMPYVMEGSPEHDYTKMQDLFKTVSEDSNIVATTDDEDRINEKEVYVDNSYFNNNPYGTASVEVSYIYKHDSIEVEEATKIWKNPKIYLNFIDKNIIKYAK